MAIALIFINAFPCQLTPRLDHQLLQSGAIATRPIQEGWHDVTY